MDFTAIDFETANSARHSACQLAAVTVRGGEIVDQQCWMIRPQPFYFHPMNIRVHGIEPERVADEPEFRHLLVIDLGPPERPVSDRSQRPVRYRRADRLLTISRAAGARIAVFLHPLGRQTFLD